MNNETNYDYSILTNHFPESVVKDFKDSAINPLLCLLNAEFLDGNKAIAELLPNATETHTNSGSLKKQYRDMYASIIKDGGTSYTGIDIENNCIATCMTLKPVTPRTSRDGKAIKYENPLKTPCTAFYPVIDADTCKLIFKHQGIDIPANFDVDQEWTLEQIVAGKVDGVWEWKNYCIDLSIKFWQHIIDNIAADIVVTEGCKKTLAGIGTGYICTGLSGIWNGAPKNELLPSLKLLATSKREIIIAFDKDAKRTAQDATYNATTKLAKLLLAEECEVREAKWEEEQGKGIDDLIANCGVKALHRVMKMLIQIEPPSKPKAKSKKKVAPVNDSDGSEIDTDEAMAELEKQNTGEEKKGVDALLDIGNTASYFHTSDKVAYADVQIDGNRHTYAVRSKAFKLWLGGEFFRKYKTGVPSQYLRDTLDTLEAIAIFQGETHEVHLRTAEHQGKIYLDLGAPDWRAVEIDATGWRIVLDPPVRFWRPASLLALPHPVEGGQLNDLRNLITPLLSLSER